MIKTAESVTPKHPDKVCDQISDAVLDECLKQDLNSRVAIETMGGHGIITVTGELTTKAYIDIPTIVRDVYGDIGVQTNIVKQSPEIAKGVDIGGAGDQGIMVGYACNENEAMIPQETYLARSLCKFIYDKYPYDGKTQITLENECIHSIVASFQNTPQNILELIVMEWLDKFNSKLKKAPQFSTYINPIGDWTQGGFDADTGLTGRKLAVDNYGPQIPIGGGAFSGKDYTKVDRTGAYYARKLAVKYLKENKAKEVIVKLAFSIGSYKPVMITGVIDNTEIDIPNNLTVKEMIKLLDLEKPIYRETAKWGHFGNNFNWDKY